ncbi:LuxR C-terminal-related transcriptional regulator [Streptomyces sp. NPDC092370]|uniref:LuxR C-terminal-related transcriptional regulator n=1 Tax=Streptomyces sp. NPDC092370 TaxID=3366016 RepID=UPI0038015464
MLLCDERPLVLDGLCSLLRHEDDIEVVDTACSAMETVMHVRTHVPQVVVIGLHPEETSILDLVRQLLGEPLDPVPRIIVFAMSDLDESLADVLHAGVSGLLTDDASREELAMAIRAVARGQAMLGPRIAQRLMEWFRDSTPKSPSKAGMPFGAVLTPREKEVLTLAARGLSTEDIAVTLFIGTATVRTHLYRLQTKLRLKDRAQLVSFAFRAGIVDPA